MKPFSLSVAILLLLFFQPFNLYGAGLKVVFLNPGHPDQNATGRFWPNVSLFMQAAAEDLDIELITINAHRNHIVMKSMVNQIVEQQPDYVVLVNEKGVAVDIIKPLSRFKIPVFMLLNFLDNEELSRLSPEQRNLIVGSLIPDNYNVGKKLIIELADLYKKQEQLADTSLITVLALQGDYSTAASIERQKGFKDGVEEIGDVLVIDSTVANWSKEQAYLKVKGILSRHKPNIIWAANDAMAFGAKQALEEVSVKHPLFIGGVNWDVDDPNFPVDVSYGGHVVMGALSLIMIKDISARLLPPEASHKKINIFVSSSDPLFPLFTQRLKLKQLNYYDFSQFGLGSREKREFSIENLSKTFNNVAER